MNSQQATPQGCLNAACIEKETHQAIFVSKQCLAIYNIPAGCRIVGLTGSHKDVKAIEGIIQRPELGTLQHHDKLLKP